MGIAGCAHAVVVQYRARSKFFVAGSTERHSYAPFVAHANRRLCKQRDILGPRPEMGVRSMSAMTGVDDEASK